MSAEEVGFLLVGVAMTLLAGATWGLWAAVFMAFFALYAAGVAVWFSTDRVIRLWEEIRDVEEEQP